MDRGGEAVSASHDWVYWTGCAANYDPRVAAVVKATAKVLGAAGVRLRFLGAEEACSGDAARRLGEEGLFQQLALQNIETLQRHGAQRIVTHCAHCFHVFKNEYPRFGGEFEVMHHVELIARLLAEGRIRLRRVEAVRATLHDSCYVGRYNGIFDAPRVGLRAVYGDGLVEMPRHGERSFCCGAGGANYWYDVAKNELGRRAAHQGGDRNGGPRHCRGMSVLHQDAGARRADRNGGWRAARSRTLRRSSPTLSIQTGNTRRRRVSLSGLRPARKSMMETAGGEPTQHTSVREIRSGSQSIAGRRKRAA